MSALKKLADGLNKAGAVVTEMAAARTPSAERIEQLDGQAADLRARREKLQAERLEILELVLGGDADARKKVDQLDKSIVDADRELSRIGEVRSRVADRMAAEKIAAAAKLADQDRASFRVALGECDAKAQAADAALDAFLLALNDMTAAQNDVRMRVNHRDLNNHLAAQHMGVAACILNRLSSAGMHTKTVPLAPEKRKIAGWLAPADWVESLYTPRVDP